MTTVTKKTAENKEEKQTELDEAQSELDKQIEVFEPVPKAKDRTFTHPETNEEKTWVQTEMGFMSKIKFFRLLAGTLRLASDTQSGSPMDFIQEAFGDGNIQNMDEETQASSFVSGMIQLVELAPDFLQESFVLILNVKPQDESWFIEALDSLDDEEGIDIIETAVAQNGNAIRRFFDKHLRRVGETISREVGNPLEEGKE